MLAMKILLQHVRSGLFFCGGELWTANSETAFDFHHSRWLREFVAKHHLQDVQMVVKFEYPDQFEVVPLQPPPVREWARIRV